MTSGHKQTSAFTNFKDWWLNFKRPSIWRVEYPIYKGTLENCIKVSSFFDNLKRDKIHDFDRLDVF